jgi:hypothetical protein
MIGWQYPAALWALPLAAMPIVVHLLRTHHARRVPFPSLRFVPSSRAAAVRVRLPSDIALMLVRVGIVALAVGALAGPIVVTRTRTAVWNARTARAVVVDVSDSMRLPDSAGATPEAAAADAAAAELRTAAYGRRIDVARLDDGLMRAARWLAASPPARREIVVISDLQRGAVPRLELEELPVGIGLRFVAVGRRDGPSTFAGAPLLGGDGVAARGQAIEARADATAVVLEAETGNGTAGLRLLAPPGAEPAVAGLLRAVAIVGAPAGSDDQPIAIRFPGAPVPLAGSVSMIQPGWMLRTVLRLREDPAIASMAVVAANEPSDGWTPLSRTRDGAIQVRAAAIRRELVLDVAARPDSLFAAEVVRAVLNARVEPNVYDEREVARVAEVMARPAGSVTSDAWRNADSTDGRWLWLLALALLGFEQWLRTRTVAPQHRESTRAAA